LIGEGVSGLLPSRSGSLDEFLAPTQAEDVSRLLNDLWRSRFERHSLQLR
jgi:hypothetical protein